MLGHLFGALQAAMDAPLEIEAAARAQLKSHQDAANRYTGNDATPMPAELLREIRKPDAHPLCAMLPELPLPWAPPQTSNDPAYQALGTRKAHVELLGPAGLVRSDTIRLGLYGILPNSEYGLRTHPAEEVFVMLAGEAWWKRASADYARAITGERSHHPSMMPHATRTGARAFLSVYAWHGDISTENYVFHGAPGSH